MNYHINELIDECLLRHYQTFSVTQDTNDYVPEKYNDKILKYIFKKLKRQFRKVDNEDKHYQWLINKVFKFDFKKNKAELKKKITIDKYQMKTEKRLAKYEIRREKIILRKEVKDKIKQINADIKKIVRGVEDV